VCAEFVGAKAPAEIWFTTQIERLASAASRRAYYLLISWMGPVEEIGKIEPFCFAERKAKVRFAQCGDDFSKAAGCV